MAVLILHSADCLNKIHINIMLRWMFMMRKMFMLPHHAYNSVTVSLTLLQLHHKSEPKAVRSCWCVLMVVVDILCTYG